MLPIYCEHFGLKREPFAITPDPAFLYLSESHKEALAQLVYGIKGRRGFVVLTGEVGTGKTTLIHCLLNELNGNTKTAMVFNIVVDAKDLLRYVCEKFGIAEPADTQKEIHDYLYLLEQFLIEAFRNGQNAALIIDEAQNLSTGVLESVRLLSNFETANDKLLQIFLVGQPELGIRLNASELRQLKQRIALRHHLRSLSLSECKDYIQRRLEVADGRIRLFTTEALEAIHEYAGGIPRIINLLCDNGLLTAYALRKTAVDPEMIAEVARDLQLTISPEATGKSSEFKRVNLIAGDRSITVSHLASLKPQAERTIPSAEAHRDIRLHSPGTAKDHGEVGTINLAQTIDERTKPTKPGSTTVSSRDIDHMITLLTECMGPMASVILKEQIAAMGESSDAFPRRRLAELIEKATREILNESAKANCKRVMLERIGRIKEISK
jgi:general secretion pathway protein A